MRLKKKSETDAMHKIFLNRDGLVQEIIQITLNHNVNMEYTPTLKEVMTAFSLEGRPAIDPHDDEYKEKCIFYKGNFVRPLWCALHGGSDAKSSHEPVASLMEVMEKAKQDGWMSSIENSLKAPRGDLLVLTDEETWAKLNAEGSGVERTNDDTCADSSSGSNQDGDDSDDKTDSDTSGRKSEDSEEGEDNTEEDSE